MKRQSTEGFQGSETIRYDPLMVDTCHYTSVQTHRMYITKRELWHNLWTLGDVSTQVRHLWHMLTAGAAVHVSGQRL